MSGVGAHRLSVPVILGLLLAACAGDGGPLPETAAPAAAGAAQEAEPEVAALPPLPRIASEEVLRYSRSDAVAAFGAPTFSRVDKGAEILRFRGEGCVLDVFLYKDPAGHSSRVAHFEARDDAGQATDRQACINATPRARG